ncbi:hypothetical protein [Actinoplanes sp. NPDC048796]|uniref:hypothetical protein n=1 Tax=Actinoplanes sp. NPDC048796 TaxID=3155640 RepID=UPI0033FD8CBE
MTAPRDEPAAEGQQTVRKATPRKPRQAPGRSQAAPISNDRTANAAEASGALAATAGAASAEKPEAGAVSAEKPEAGAVSAETPTVVDEAPAEELKAAGAGVRVQEPAAGEAKDSKAEEAGDARAVEAGDAQAAGVGSAEKVEAAGSADGPGAVDAVGSKAGPPRARRSRAAKTAATGGGVRNRGKAASGQHVQEELIPQEPTVSVAEFGREAPAATVWKEPASPVPGGTEAETAVPRSEAETPAREPAVVASPIEGAAVVAGSEVAYPVRQAKVERTDPWAGLIADPARAPELLAIAAVQTLGPRAKEWAARTREAYPAAGTDALVRLATRQFTRWGSVTGILGAVAGSYAPVALLGAAALTDAELALHIAAAHGLDPTDEERAVDLLVIGRVHASRAEAVDALAEARRPAYDSKEPLWRLARMLTAQTAAWAAVKVVNRRFPGTSLLAAFLATTSSAQATAARAAKYFKSARSS